MNSTVERCYLHLWWYYFFAPFPLIRGCGLAKTLKLEVWALSLIFCILTPFDHFQIRPTFAVTPNLILEPCFGLVKKGCDQHILFLDWKSRLDLVWFWFPNADNLFWRSDILLVSPCVKLLGLAWLTPPGNRWRQARWEFIIQRIKFQWKIFQILSTILCSRSVMYSAPF